MVESAFSQDNFRAPIVHFFLILLNLANLSQSVWMLVVRTVLVLHHRLKLLLYSYVILKFNSFLSHHKSPERHNVLITIRETPNLTGFLQVWQRLFSTPMYHIVNKQKIPKTRKFPGFCMVANYASFGPNRASSSSATLASSFLKSGTGLGSWRPMGISVRCHAPTAPAPS